MVHAAAASDMAAAIDAAAALRASTSAWYVSERSNSSPAVSYTHLTLPTKA